MGCRVTMFFNAIQGQRVVGWSETYISNQTTPQLAQNEWFGGPGSVAIDRIMCLGSGCSNIFNKVTQVLPGLPAVGPQRRATLISPGYGQNAVGQAYNQALTTFPFDFAQTALGIKLTSDPSAPPVYTRNMWLAGIPDAATTTDKPGLGPNIVNGAVVTFLNDLQKISSILSIDRSLGNPPRNCTGYNSSPNTYTCPAHGFSANQRVLAFGFRSAAGGFRPSGSYQVIVVDANTIGLVGAKPATLLTVLGAFRAVSYVFTNIFGVINRGITNHKRGRPFGQFLGRARTKTRTRS